MAKIPDRKVIGLTLKTNVDLTTVLKLAEIKIEHLKRELADNIFFKKELMKLHHGQCDKCKSIYGQCDCD